MTLKPGFHKRKQKRKHNISYFMVKQLLRKHKLKHKTKEKLLSLCLCYRRACFHGKVSAVTFAFVLVLVLVLVLALLVVTALCASNIFHLSSNFLFLALFSC